jgi:Invasin, domain 3
MNLKRKKARIPIAALGVAALCSSGLGLVSSAAAAGALTLTPTTTSVTTLDIAAAKTATDVGTRFNLVQPLSNATFATRVTSTVSALQLQVESYTAPTGVTTSNPFLYYAEMTTGGTTGPAPIATDVGGAVGVPDSGPWIQLDADNATPPSATLTGSSSAATKDVFLAADVPGTYKFHFTDPGVQAGTDDDVVSPTITMTVLDAYGATAAAGVTTATSDDWTPTISNSVPSAGIGAPLVGNVSLSDLTLVDSRGSSSSVGVLNNAVKSLVGIAFTGAGTSGATNTQTAVSAAGNRSLAAGATTTSGTLTTSAVFDYDGNGVTATARALGTPATTTINGNGVSVVVLDAKDVTGSVMEAGGAVAVKTGTAAVSYTATVTDSDSDKSGNVVNFTLGGADVATLTTNGTTVDSTNHIFSAVTDSTGVATLIVTSSKTTAGTTYTVDASSNAHSGSQLVALYADPVADSIESTNTDAELTPTAASGVSVTLKGKLLDQFGAAFTPSSSGTQTVTVTVPPGVTTICNAVITGGTFSCTYTPATAPTAGTSTNYRYAYTGGLVYNGTINWASTTAAASITLTTPSATVTNANLSDSTALVVGQSTGSTGTTGGVDADDFGSATGQVTGTVYDASHNPLAFKSVTLSGGDGVYFSTSNNPTTGTDDDLNKTLTVVTNASGVFGGGYAFFTKAGTVKVTATSGTAVANSSVTTDTSGDPYKVTVNDVTGEPGATLIITGTLMDAFENPVPGYSVNLSIGTSTLGAFGNNSPTTNAAGVFSTTFTSGSNQSGTADLTATIPGMTTNPTAITAYSTDAGLTVPHGEYMDTASITLEALKLTLNSTAKVIGDGSTSLTGSFSPNTGVDIYSKPSGADSYTLMDSVQTDDQGDFGGSYGIKKTTLFLAKANGLSSATTKTEVWSKVVLTGTSKSHNRATLSANGGPSAKGTLTFYRSVAGKDPILKTITSNSNGNGTVTVSLPKGTRVVYAVFKAPGTGAGTSKSIKVKVK